MARIARRGALACVTEMSHESLRGTAAPCLGLACLEAWSQTVFSDRFFVVPGEGAFFAAAVHLVGTLVALATALVLGLGGSRIRGYRSRAPILAVGGLGTLGSLGVVLSGWGGFGDAGAFLFNALVCLASVWLTIAWYQCLVEKGLRMTFVCLFVALLAGGMLGLVVQTLPWGASAALVVALPICAALPIRNARAAVYETPASEEYSREGGRGCLPLVVLVGLASYASGVFINMELLASGQPGASFGAVAGRSALHVMVMLCALLMAALSVRVGPRPILAGAAGTMLVSAVMLFVVPAAPQAPLYFMARTGAEAVRFLAIAVIVTAVSDGASGLRLLGLMVAAQFAGTLVGQVSALLLVGDTASTAALLMVDLVVMLIVAFLAGATGPFGEGGAHGERAVSTPGAERRDSRLDTVALLALRHGLTSRETEVARLWVAGHNSAYIEQTLCISKYTVRTHLKAIYEKTGTANKEELIRATEALADGQP